MAASDGKARPHLPGKFSYSMHPAVHLSQLGRPRAGSASGSSPSSSSSSAYVYVDLPPATGAGDDDLKGAAPPLRSLSFAAKLLQLLLAVAAEALYVPGAALIADNFRTFIFPHVVFSTFIIVGCLVVTSYLLHIKMQELLLRTLSMVAFAMMMTSSGAVLRYCAVMWSDWSEDIKEREEVADPAQWVDGDLDTATLRACLAVHALLAGACALLHLADCATSLARTLRAL